MQAMAERNFSLHRIWFRAKIHLISLVFFLFWFFASFAAYGVWGKNGFLIVFMSSFLVFAIVAMRIFYKKESSERVITQNIQKDILGDREDTD
jgi:hypothetical protein